MNRPTALLAVAALLAQASLSQAQQAITSPAGTFQPTVSVDPQLLVSDTVAEINAQLANNDFAGAESTYQSSGLLQEYGQGNNLSGPVFDEAKAFFGGSANFNQDYLLNEAFTQTEAPAKLEMVQKTVMDAIPVQAILSLAYAARQGDQAQWDRACALYIGNTEASPYARAEKRAANYGTMTNNVATANSNILSACNSGPSVASYNTILKNIQVIYAQAAIRYARLLDVDYMEDLSTVDHRAEGQAFYRIIAPMVKSADSVCHDTMDQLYNFDKTPMPGKMYYCAAVDCIPAALDISDDQLGTLEDTEGVCEGTATINTPAGNFSPQQGVYDQLQVSTTVNSIKNLISNGDFSAAENAYINSGLLRTYGRGEGLSGPVFNQARSFHGSADFNDQYLIDEAFTASENAEIAEMVEKTVMDAIPVQALLSLAYAGRSGDRASWDKACALYIGQPHLASSPYERAEKRADNFGTTANGVARVNSAVVSACANPSSENYEQILKAVKIIYTQASIRYARLLDVDFEEGLSTADHRAEGQAFYRIIAPMVAAVDADCHAAMDELYNFSKQPDANKTYYCEAVACIPEAMELSTGDIGVLEDTEGVCDGAGASNTPGDDSSAAGVRILSGLLLAAGVTAFLM
mmetsp:Transcript_34531/g.87118  ORF Transcript_34531/g.87118 Transcript_34531/m.87118 type:complete len:636 (-) Transcript_34531:228-2135(-)